MSTDQLLPYDIEWASADTFNDPGQVWDGKENKFIPPAHIREGGALPNYPVPAEYLNYALNGTIENQKRIALAALGSWRIVDDGTAFSAGELASPIVEAPGIGIITGGSGGLNVLAYSGKAYGLEGSVGDVWDGASKDGVVVILSSDGNSLFRIAAGALTEGDVDGNGATDGWSVVATNSHFYAAIGAGSLAGEKRIWRSSTGALGSWSNYYDPPGDFPEDPDALAANGSTLIVTNSARTGLSRAVNGGALTAVVSGATNIRNTLWSTSLGKFVQTRGSSNGQLWTSTDGQSWAQETWFSSALLPVDNGANPIAAFSADYPNAIGVFGKVLIGTFTRTIASSNRGFVMVNTGFIDGVNEWRPVLIMSQTFNKIVPTRYGVLVGSTSGSSFRIYGSSFI